MEQSADAIAENLRRVRETRGLSLDQLADLTGVSKSMLRQIETGKSSPTITTIWKIANGLRISFTALLRKPEIQVEVKSFRSGKPLLGGSAGCRLFPLIPFDPHLAFETYYFEIDPCTDFSGEPHEGNIHEYVFVIKGVLQISIDDESFTINSQEFLQFHANRPHSYKCVGPEMATAIMQVSYLP
jgi:DNA-binding XRE family transcriptional regulator/quercetin dioxygenase-like cupin family protein